MRKMTSMQIARAIIKAQELGFEYFGVRYGMGYHVREAIMNDWVSLSKKYEYPCEEWDELDEESFCDVELEGTLAKFLGEKPIEDVIASARDDALSSGWGGWAMYLIGGKHMSYYCADFWDACGMTFGDDDIVISDAVCLAVIDDGR